MLKDLWLRILFGLAIFCVLTIERRFSPDRGLWCRGRAP